MAEILARNSGLRDRRVVILVLVWDQCLVIRCSRERYNRGVVLAGNLWAQRRVVDQIRGDLRGPLFHNLRSSSGRGSGVAQQSGRGSGGRGQAQAGRGQARVFAMTHQNAQASNAVVKGILFICSRDAHVLFDPGATHSFVSLSFATKLGKSHSSLDETLAVTTPVGEIMLADCVYHSCVVSIGGKELFVNLIALYMVDFDMILGMDWLASHYATLDYHNKVVKFEMSGESTFSFQGEEGN
ncbi:Aspartic peptidase domain superfamily [Sesbania bispinosa]|nr:Aspartic peptidase domain superfamily [Sesbania bispinosa]